MNGSAPYATPQRIRVAHLIHGEDYQKITSRSRVSLFLGRGLDPNQYQHVAVFQDVLPPEIKTDVFNRYNIHVVDGRRACSDLAGELRGADVAIVYHDGASHLAFAAAEAAGVPVIIEHIDRAGFGQQYDCIDWTVCTCASLRLVQPYPERASSIYWSFDPDTVPRAPSGWANGRTLRMALFAPVQESDVALMRKTLGIAQSLGIPIRGVIVGETGDPEPLIDYVETGRDVLSAFENIDIVFCDSAPAPETREELVAALAFGRIPLVGSHMNVTELFAHGINGFFFRKSDAYDAARIIHSIWRTGQSDPDRLRNLLARISQSGRRAGVQGLVAEYDHLIRSLSGKTKSRVPTPVQPGEDAAHRLIEHLLSNEVGKFTAALTDYVGARRAAGPLDLVSKRLSRLQSPNPQAAGQTAIGFIRESLDRILKAMTAQDFDAALEASTDLASRFAPPRKSGPPRMNPTRSNPTRGIRGIEAACDEISDFVNSTVPDERTWLFEVPAIFHGAVREADRLAWIAAYCASRFPGDFVEIGALVGHTTVRLAEVAREYGRRVIVVDPWTAGTSGCRGWEYEIFLRNTASYSDLIDVIRDSSLSPAAQAALRDRELCFAYVDGLHSYDACLSDIMSVAHAHGVIAVDDVLGIDDVSRALADAAGLIDRLAIRHPLFREGYLLSPACAAPGVDWEARAHSGTALPTSPPPVPAEAEFPPPLPAAS